MYVKDHMTPSPYCIFPNTSVSKAIDILEQKDFRRLPVIDENEKLIGLVTEERISDSSGAQSTALDIYELNYLLSRTMVSDIMIKDVITIGPDALLEEAANTMLQKKVNALPVVDENNKVIGIITERDIFKAFIDLLGFNEEGTRFVINMKEDRPGEFERVSNLFSSNNVNLKNFAVYHNERGIEVVIIVSGDCEFMKDILEKEEGWKVTEVKKQNIK
ncbi:MAG: CBS domain-containing protein [Solobacterium sp.]|nr:CBS domain-containing protein [Solobacterium sp.]